MRRAAVVVAALVVAFGSAEPAGAWGAYGHRIISAVAIAALPESVPAFVRTPEAQAAIRLLGPEPDNLKGDKNAFDRDRFGAHFLDLEDDGTVQHAVALNKLPATRQGYEDVLRARGHSLDDKPTQWEAGYLPYEILEGWQVVARDFAFWRVAVYGESHATADSDRAAWGQLRRLREMLTLRDIGYWSHFVADGSQPLHVSIHYNGWGQYPNPQNYSNSKTIHARFETTFVNGHATEALVLPRVGAYTPGTGPMLPRVEQYLLATNGHVEDVYKLEAADAFARATPGAVSFTLDRLADGARALRDWIADAWTASADEKIGYPPVPVRDIESGAVVFPPSRLGD
jgi:hypothetical protein